MEALSLPNTLELKRSLLMIVLTDAQAIVVHRLLTCILLNETYRLADVEDALVWTSPENRQILCPFDNLWSRNLAQEIVRLMSDRP